MRILIVEDDLATADALRMLLGVAGHEVKVAHRGDEAITLTTTFTPELAILDIQLPDTTGFAVARKLRQRAGRRVHIVGITGGDHRTLPLASSFDQHARKPLTPARLYQVVDVAREALRGAG